jgi:hypothetical protein
MGRKLEKIEHGFAIKVYKEKVFALHPAHFAALAQVNSRCAS